MTFIKPLITHRMLGYMELVALIVRCLGLENELEIRLWKRWCLVCQLKGTLDGMDPTVITEIASYYEHEIGYKVASILLLLEKTSNVTRAGIHADGLLKIEEIYNIFDTDKF